jgi:ATP-dependent exoDNAse (exonuclease V) alpha subunit
MYNNGEMGTVIDLKNDSVIVRSDSGHEITLNRYEWEIKKHVADYDENGNVIIGTKKIGSFEQFPVRLAWAITVHKAQGQTYDNVNIIPDNFFAEGQMYVALSRCRTKEGMHIVGTLVPWRLKCNQRVKDFMLNANR